MTAAQKESQAPLNVLSCQLLANERNAIKTTALLRSGRKYSLSNVNGAIKASKTKDTNLPLCNKNVKNRDI